MHKDKKSKKNSISKLHKILDNSSDKDLHPKDEKDFRSLKKRLKETSNGNKIYRPVSPKDDNEIDSNSLKPKVTIYPGKVKKIDEFPDIKEQKIIEFPEIKDQETITVDEKFSTLPVLPVKEDQKESKYDDEEVFEVKKVEVSEPEFIKVEPKEIEKEEKVEIFEEKKALADEEIVEWEPVDIIEKKAEVSQEDKKPDEHDKKEEKPKEDFEVATHFCNQCGTKIKDKVNFCPECGSKTITDFKESKVDESKSIEKTESIPAFIPIEKVEEKEQPKLKEETAIIELPKTEEKEILVKPGIDRESKIEVFKDIESINEKTAIILYDNGFTSLDLLTLASLKDLTKIKGIKRKQAKKIQKEIQQKSEWQPVDINEKDEIEVKEGIDLNESITEDEITLKITEKEDELIEHKIEEKDEIIIEREVKIEAFKDMESINDETAVLLYDNGFTTVDSLKEVDLKNLVKIKGIKRKKAKKIQKEIEKKIEESAKIKPIVIGETAEGKVTEEQIQEKDEIIEKKEESPSSVELSTKSSEWGPITEEEQEKQEILNKLDVDRKNKIEVFKDIESINEKTAIILYDNGFTSLDLLTLASLKDLTKIKGIKRKQAKKIQKEIQQKSEWQPVDFKDEDEIKEEKDFNEDLIEEIESKKDEASEIDEKIISYEPVKADEEKFDVEEEEDVPLLIEDDEEVFKDINSIDEKTAKLLKENGINSIDTLNNTTIKELTKIRGIKGKIAKRIKKEVEKLTEKTDDRTAEEVALEESFDRGENPFIQEDEDEWDSFDEDKISDTKRSEIKGFRHGDYTLFKKEIETKSGKKRIVRFFSKAEPEDGVAIELPDDYEVKVNKKTGVPYLIKKK